MTGGVVQVPAWPVVVPSALVLMVVGTAVLVRAGRLTVRRATTVVATAVYAAAVLTLTFFPLQIATGDHGNRVSWLEKANLVPVLTIDIRTFALNVVMFVPFGVLLPLWRRALTSAGVARWGLALSAAIEAGQWATDILVSSGRATDVNDLIANTAGAVLGYWALRAAATSMRRCPVDAWAVAPRIPDEVRSAAQSVPAAVEHCQHTGGEVRLVSSSSSSRKRRRPQRRQGAV